ncbi:MAG: ribonuclease E/G [Paracoccaceae bacterium]
MQKKLLIDASHREETRIVLLDRDQVEEFDFESGQKKQLAGNIFLAKVTRVEPSLQAAFLDYGGNRHGFLAFSEIHPDYYQIPVADKEALLAEENTLDENSEGLLDQIVTEDVSAETIKSYANVNDITHGTIKSEPLSDDKIDTDTRVSSNSEKEPFQQSSPTKLIETNAVEPTVPVNHDPKQDTEPNLQEKVLNEPIQKKKPRKNRYKIQEVIKVRQVLLIQVVKDERGNKGAALTTYMSLAGRYCVLMPNTAKGGGISRKITNIVDRKKLKETASQFSIPDKMGLIIRTAGAKRTKVEIKRDFEYLLRQWEQIRDLTLKSIAPCPIYEEGSVIKRSIRDLYNKEINEIIVEGEEGFKEAKEYMKMLMPSHAKKIINYEKNQPIFAFYGVENYLSAMFNPTVQLKSGGYIVIGITEALVAIDVNSGRATKESGIEATALRTNLEAAEEISRQLRMRDLAGLIVIDFIDMEEKKNNNAVERKTRESLKLDRARIQIGRISSFGLLEMSRQRLRYGMVEATTQPCPNCHGTGLTRSNENLALSILRAIENKKTTPGIQEVIVKAPVEVANYLLNQKRNHLAVIETRLNMSITVQADNSLNNPNFTLEINKAFGISDDLSAAKVITIDGAKSGSQEESEFSNTVDLKPGNQNGNSEGIGRRQKRRRRRNNKSKQMESATTQTSELPESSTQKTLPDSAVSDIKAIKSVSRKTKGNKPVSKENSKDLALSTAVKKSARKKQEHESKKFSTEKSNKQVLPTESKKKVTKKEEKKIPAKSEDLGTTSDKIGAKKRLVTPVTEVLRKQAKKKQITKKKPTWMKLKLIQEVPVQVGGQERDQRKKIILSKQIEKLSR